jgi:hypothetical protein
MGMTFRIIFLLLGWALFDLSVAMIIVSIIKIIWSLLPHNEFESQQILVLIGGFFILAIALALFYGAGQGPPLCYSYEEAHPLDFEGPSLLNLDYLFWKGCPKSVLGVMLETWYIGLGIPGILIILGII